MVLPERFLYVFCCPNDSCSDKEGSWRALRLQGPPARPAELDAALPSEAPRHPVTSGYDLQEETGAAAAAGHDDWGLGGGDDWGLGGENDTSAPSSGGLSDLSDLNR